MKKIKPKKSSESSLSLENSDSLKNFIENQFQCSICKDIFVSPTIINCGHTFCDKCTVRTVNDFLGQQESVQDFLIKLDIKPLHLL